MAGKKPEAKPQTEEKAPQQQATPFQVIETAINKAFKSGVFDMNEGAIVLNAMAALKVKEQAPAPMAKV